ncbi:MAG: sigma 54-interacting transcriptional regulator [Desulfovibrio sp.]|nr:sigma 54-interacting transcriptional regulator [Desulfovibrio sp.]
MNYIEQFKMLFDNAGIGIIIADVDGIIVYYNSAQARIDRLEADTVTGRYMCNVYKFTRNTSPAMQVLRTERPIENNVYYYSTRSGNLVYASCDIYPLHTKKKKLIGVVCYSISYTDLANHIRNVQDIINDRRSALSPAAKADNTASHYSFASIIGANPQLQKAVVMAKVAATSSASVMIIGETGVGKEVFAQAIHYGSPRAAQAYTAINCSAVPEALLEGILFGTSRGAFTGAVDKPGLFETANGGTFFLDEIDSMPVSLQSKLLRTLQEMKIRRVGEAIERSIDVRILCAVAQHPKELLGLGVLRPDLYYRLGVIKVFLPPLRERMDDLAALCKHLLFKHNPSHDGAPPDLSPEAMALLAGHNWPGNVRELEHVLEATLSIERNASRLEARHFIKACPDIFPALAHDAGKGHGAGAASTSEGAAQSAQGAHAVPSRPLAPLLANRKSMEEKAIRDALSRAAGNKSLASRLLGISPQLLSYKAKKFGLNASEFVPR